MKVLVISAVLLASCSAQVITPWTTPLVNPYYGVAPYVTPYAAHPVAPYVPSVAPVAPYVPAVAPVVSVPTASQYRVQDELGQFRFGHSSENQAREEVKTFDGTVRGAYSYVDPTGKLVNVQYLADDNGFRVLGANNLPEAPAVPVVTPLKGPEPVVDTPEVIAARADFEKAFAKAALESKEEKPEEKPEEEKKEEEKKERRKRQILYTGGVFPTTYVSGLTHYSPIASLAPLAPVAPVIPLTKTTFKTAELKPVDAMTPAATKKAEIEEKTHEVVSSPLAPVVLGPQFRSITLTKEEKEKLALPLFAPGFIY